MKGPGCVCGKEMLFVDSTIGEGGDEGGGGAVTHHRKPRGSPRVPAATNTSTRVTS